ncbi:integrase [Mycobacteroides franklinii]|nr:integrase [Mycobacteroides franklinii]
MVGHPVVGKARVQVVGRGPGRVAYAIVSSGGVVDSVAAGFLRGCSAGTSRTYAYLLLDHVRWLESERRNAADVTLGDLKRYMGAAGAEYRGPFGRPWRVGKKAYSQRSLMTLAACLKGFYLYQGSLGVGAELARQLRRTRLPTVADRRRALLGHGIVAMPANPLTPKPIVRRRHPKLPPEDARQRLLESAASARDRMVVTWLSDGGFRVGELCGLHLVDLHLREDAACGQCAAHHVHICHREDAANGARVKTKDPWSYEAGLIQGGMVRRASPAMVHTYFDYMSSEYPHTANHGMLLVQLHGPRRGEPLATSAVRAMLTRASGRAGLAVRVRPHAFRHQFATDVLVAAEGNSLIARDAGGWRSATTVEEIYGHVDVSNPQLSAALSRVWGERS